MDKFYFVRDEINRKDKNSDYFEKAMFRASERAGIEMAVVSPEEVEGTGAIGIVCRPNSGAYVHGFLNIYDMTSFVIFDEIVTGDNKKDIHIVSVGAGELGNKMKGICNARDVKFSMIHPRKQLEEYQNGKVEPFDTATHVVFNVPYGSHVGVYEQLSREYDCKQYDPSGCCKSETEMNMREIGTKTCDAYFSEFKFFRRLLREAELM